MKKKLMRFRSVGLLAVAFIVDSLSITSIPRLNTVIDCIGILIGFAAILLMLFDSADFEKERLKEALVEGAKEIVTENDESV